MTWESHIWRKYQSPEDGSIQPLGSHKSALHMTLCGQIWSNFGSESTLDFLLIKNLYHSKIICDHRSGRGYDSVMHGLRLGRCFSCHLLSSLLNAHQCKAFLQYRSIATHKRFLVSFLWEGGAVSLALKALTVSCLTFLACLSSEMRQV